MLRDIIKLSGDLIVLYDISDESEGFILRNLWSAFPDKKIEKPLDLWLLYLDKKCVKMLR